MYPYGISCMFQNLIISNWAKNINDLPFGLKPPPPFVFPLSENGTRVCSAVETYTLFAQHSFSKNYPSLNPLCGCTMTSCVEWPKATNQTLTNESILLDFCIWDSEGYLIAEAISCKI